MVPPFILLLPFLFGLAWLEQLTDTDLNVNSALVKVSGGTDAEPRSFDSVKVAYDRNFFGSWSDDDDDCRNTRHELLASLSTTAVRWSVDGCRVIRGRWNDPYTGRVFFEAHQLDIDHLVSLKWAWEHGASVWSRERRIEFANDARNLFAVDDSTNQSKGAASPTAWLPPDAGFHCQYVVRFQRIVRIYGISLNTLERREIASISESVC